MQTELSTISYLGPNSPGMNSTNWKRHNDRLKRHASSAIRHQLGAYERYLVLIGRKSTSRKYGKCIEKFLALHPERKEPGLFDRCHIEDFKVQRIQQGASKATIRVELSAVRNFFQWMLDMQVEGLFYNPAKNVTISLKSNSAD